MFWFLLCVQRRHRTFCRMHMKEGRGITGWRETRGKERASREDWRGRRDERQGITYTAGKSGSCSVHPTTPTKIHSAQPPDPPPPPTPASLPPSKPPHTGPHVPTISFPPPKAHMSAVLGLKTVLLYYCYILSLTVGWAIFIVSEK